MSAASALTGKAKRPPDGGGSQVGRDGLLVVVVSGNTVGTGESCSGTRPITMLILRID